jgi:hypothetical protein
MFEIKYSLNVEPETDVTPEDSFATGDEAQDAEICKEIRDRLEPGDVWAWCYIVVTAEMDLGNGLVFSGRDSLGGCSYDNQEDFLKCPYYTDMKTAARNELVENMKATAKQGMVASELLFNYRCEEGGFVKWHE